MKNNLTVDFVFVSSMYLLLKFISKYINPLFKLLLCLKQIYVNLFKGDSIVYATES